MDEYTISCDDAKNIVKHGQMVSGMRVDLRTLMMYPIDEKCACDVISDILKNFDEKQKGLEETYGSDSKEAYELMIDKSYVAENKHIPEDCACDIFSKMAKDKRHYMRLSVAQNNSIPDSCKCEILAGLAEGVGEVAKDMLVKSDSYYGTRLSVALRQDIPPECREKILSKLVLDPNGTVRKAAKRNLPVKKFSMW